MDPTMGAGENLADVQTSTETTTQETVAESFNSEVPAGDTTQSDVADAAAQSTETTEVPGESTENVDAFNVPEAYADKGWAKDLKNIDDVYKMLDNAQSLIGKKQTGEIDVANMNDDQLKGLFEKVRPESVDGYELHESIQGDEADVLRAAAHEFGLHPTQLTGVIEKYREFAQSQLDQAYDPKHFEDAMQAEFGDKYTAQVSEVDGLMEKLVTPEVKQAIDQIAPAQRAAVYNAMAKLKNAFGATEGGVSDSIDGAGGYANAQEAYDRALYELQSLQSEPHTQAQKDAALQKVYAAQNRLK